MYEASELMKGKQRCAKVNVRKQEHFSLGKLQRASGVHENKGMGVDAAGLAALIRQPLAFIRVLESRGN